MLLIIVVFVKKNKRKRKERKRNAHCDTMKITVFLLYSSDNCLLYCCTTVYVCSCVLYLCFTSAIFLHAPCMRVTSSLQKRKRHNIHHDFFFVTCKLKVTGIIFLMFVVCPSQIKNYITTGLVSNFFNAPCMRVTSSLQKRKRHNIHHDFFSFCDL